MFGWLKKKSSAQAAAIEWTEYNGFRLAATPIPEGGQFRISGRIEQGEGETLKTHTFIRADLIPTEKEARELSMKKAQLMVDQLGDRVFDA